MKFIKYLFPAVLSIALISCSTETESTDEVDGIEQTEDTASHDECEDDCTKKCCAKDKESCSHDSDKECSAEEKAACAKKCEGHDKEAHACTKECGDDCKDHDKEAHTCTEECGDDCKASDKA